MSVGIAGGPRPFESRAAIALTALAGFSAFILLSVGPGLWSPDHSRLSAVATTALVLLEIALCAGLGIGLVRGQRWAVSATRPVLVILLVVGVAGAVGKLVSGVLPIPIDVVLVGWALRGASATSPAPRFRRAAAAAVAAALVWAVGGAALGPAVGPRGALDVAAADLDSSLTADCGPAGSGDPATIEVTYRWSWSRRPLLPTGADIVVIHWFAGGGGDELQPYVLGDAPAPAAGITPGGGTGDAQAGAQAFSSQPAWEWGIDPLVQAYRPGEIHAVLQRARMTSSSGVQLEVLAKYFHAGAWESGLVSASCQW